MPKLEASNNEKIIKATLRAEAAENGVEVTEHEIDIAYRVREYIFSPQGENRDLSAVAEACGVTLEDIERTLQIGDEIRTAWLAKNST